MDRTQAAMFFNCLLGFTPIGIDGNGGEVDRANSPEMRAFITGQLGDLTPSDWHSMTHRPEDAHALAAMLRNAADAIVAAII